MTMDTTLTNLHVGCGHNRMAGFTNADLYPTDATDLCFNLEAPWPLETNSQLQVYASHVVEHLADWQTFFQQAWRVLQPGGQLYLRLPYGGHPAAWWDFGHVRPWFVENFTFFQPGYARQVGNPQHDGWQWPFAVARLALRLSESVVHLVSRLPLRCLRQWVLSHVRHSAYAVEELFVWLQPLKSHEAVQQWLTLNSPNVLPCEYVGWQHHWERRQRAPSEHAALRTLAQGVQLNGYA